jgi:hypothetical protein
MSLEITGKVFLTLPEQSGQGKNGSWIKQEFIVETEEQFPRKICFSAWGDKVPEVKNLSKGEEIIVSFNVESREFNNKWYTDLRAWKIAKSGATQTPIDLPPISENDIPFDEQEGDLPF